MPYHGLSISDPSRCLLIPAPFLPLSLRLSGCGTSLLVFKFCFETGSYCVDQAGKVLGLTMCANMPV